MSSAHLHRTRGKRTWATSKNPIEATQRGSADRLCQSARLGFSWIPGERKILGERIGKCSAPSTRRAWSWDSISCYQPNECLMRGARMGQLQTRVAPQHFSTNVHLCGHIWEYLSLRERRRSYVCESVFVCTPQVSRSLEIAIFRAYRGFAKLGVTNPVTAHSPRLLHCLKRSTT